MPLVKWQKLSIVISGVVSGSALMSGFLYFGLDAELVIFQQ